MLRGFQPSALVDGVVLSMTATAQRFLARLRGGWRPLLREETQDA